jgi:hypothetical protein
VKFLDIPEPVTRREWKLTDPLASRPSPPGPRTPRRHRRLPLTRPALDYSVMARAASAFGTVACRCRGGAPVRESRVGPQGRICWWPGGESVASRIGPGGSRPFSITRHQSGLIARPGRADQDLDPPRSMRADFEGSCRGGRTCRALQRGSGRTGRACDQPCLGLGIASSGLRPIRKNGIRKDAARMQRRRQPFRAW